MLLLKRRILFACFCHCLKGVLISLQIGLVVPAGRLVHQTDELHMEKILFIFTIVVSSWFLTLYHLFLSCRLMAVLYKTHRDATSFLPHSKRGGGERGS